MAFLKHSEASSTKEMLTTLKELDNNTSKIVEFKQHQERTIHSHYRIMQETEANTILKGMDIENINIDKDNIRVSTLRQAGITTIYQVLGLSKEQLCQIDGIAETSADKIQNAAVLLKDSTMKSVSIPLDPNAGSDSIAIINALFVLIQQGTIFRRAQELHDTNHDIIFENTKDVLAKTSSIKWFFASKQEKTNANSAEEALNAVYHSDYINTVQEILASYQSSGSVNNTSYTHFSNNPNTHRNRAVIANKEAITAFTTNSAPFYAMLEQVLGNDFAKSEITGETLLPAELLNQIEHYELDLHRLKANLRRYQQFGTQYILYQEKVLLGDEMGLGKTMQAIAAFCHLAKEHGREHFLVVCPLSVVVNWQREIENQSDLPVIEVYGDNRAMEMTQWVSDGGVAVTTFETLNKIPLPVTVSVDLMVVDEAHYIKNPEAQRTKAVVAAMEQSKRVLLMSGTPLENRIEEMQFLISCLQPDIAEEIKNMKKLADAERFRTAIAPVYLRRVREDVLKELPELIEKEQWGILNTTELAAYRQALSTENFMLVRQISWQVADLKQSTKANRLLEIWEEAKQTNRKLIIFSYFKDVLTKVANMLGDSCIGLIDGSIPSDQRQGYIDSLGNAPAGSALVAQIQAGGVGLNIQAASIVVFCEPQIKPSLETQAIARAYRMGQSQSVIVHRLLMQDSVDERIMEILKQKTEIFSEFANESVIGDMDMLANETEIMKTIVKDEINKMEQSK